MTLIRGKYLAQVLRIAVTCLVASVALILISMTLLPQVTASKAEVASGNPPSPYLLKSDIVHPARMFAQLNRQSVAYDSQGHPHVVYGNDALYHAWYDGSQWQVETLDSNTGWVETTPAIAIQGNDIHVAYLKDAHLYYAHWDGTQWHSEQLELDLLAWSVTIAVEPQAPHVIHIIYTSEHPSQFDYAVRHVWHDDLGWHSETVDNHANARDIMLKIAPTTPSTLDVAYIDESDSSNQLLKYAWHDNQGWHIEQVAGNYGLYSTHIAFALMPTAPFTPYLGYTDFPDSRVYLRQRGQAGWQSESIFDPFGPVWDLQGLAFEPTAPYTTHVVYGTSVITFGGATEAYVRHSWGDGQSWQFETIARDQSEDGVLAVEPTTPYTLNRIYLANSNLQFAQRSASTWSNTIVDARGPAGAFNSLAIAPTTPFTPHVAYVYHGDLYHAWQSGTTWFSQTVDTVGNLETVGRYGKHVSLALAPGDPFTSSVAYYEAGTDQLRYAYFNGIDWFTSTVAASGWYPSLAIEPTAPFTPHISYIDRGSSHLTHAWLNDGTWLTETVDDEALAGGDSTALAIASGAPYTRAVVYYDQAHGALNYGQHAAGGWITQTIAYQPYTGSNAKVYAKVAIAFEPVTPYILHLGYVWAHHGNMWSFMDVRHAQLTNSGWQTETVIQESIFGSNRDLSLAIEPQAPYRLFMEFINANGQFLAYKQMGTWQIQRWSNQTSDRDQYSSLALAPTLPTVPYIAYVSPIAGDLTVWSGSEPDHFAFLPMMFRSSP